MKKKIIIFQHSLDGFGEHNLTKEEVEFDIDVTEEEITEAYREWVWETVGDHFTWYDKEDE